MFVKPAKPGLIIRIPEKYPGMHHEAFILPDGGADVPENSYWLRRLLFGEVIKAEPPAQGSGSNGNVTIVEGSVLQEHNL